MSLSRWFKQKRSSKESVSRSDAEGNSTRSKSKVAPTTNAKVSVGRKTPHLPVELWSAIIRFASASEDQEDGVSFMQHATNFDYRLASYRAHVRWKASLTRVCRLWNILGQEFLYEFIWLSRASEARWLAGRLCGDMGLPGVGMSVSVEGPAKTKKMKKQCKAKLASAPLPLPAQPKRRPAIGPYIRRLLVETLSLDRCSPHDLLLIVQHCPMLSRFSDHRSIRRPMHPLVVSTRPQDVVAPFATPSGSSLTGSGLHLTAALGNTLPESFGPCFSGQSSSSVPILLSTLLSSNAPLTRLSYTHYTHDPSDFAGGADFLNGVADALGCQVGPTAVGDKLEFLGLSLSGCSMGMQQGRDGQRRWDVGERAQEKALRTGLLGFSGSTALQSNWLTELRADWSTTCSSISTSSLRAPPPHLSLPSLRSLKATLDNATFYVLSTWDLPKLRNLSIISADFSYAGRGFARFFEVHGEKVRELELGHSSGDIEEYWVTEPPANWVNATPEGPPNTASVTPHPATYPTPPLSTWIPNLTHFICSADAEWNWQSPDWISPHVLLPSHPGVQVIGIRDMDRRIWDDLGVWEGRVRGGEVANRYGGDGEDGPLFSLLEQYSSLLRCEAFPSLFAVRDLSVESEGMRKGSLPTPSDSSTSLDLDSRGYTKHDRIGRFWKRVVTRCEERGVVLQDWRGEEVVV